MCGQTRIAGRVNRRYNRRGKSTDVKREPSETFCLTKLMKTIWSKQSHPLPLCAIIALSAGRVHAQIYVADYSNSTVGEYNPNSGAAINAAFVSALDFPTTLAVSGNNLYVANWASSSIGLYNRTTGAAMSPSFITGVDPQGGMIVSGNTLYVGNYFSGVVSTWNATTGALINPTLLTTPSQAQSNPGVIESLAISGNNLYVSYNATTVGEYNATTGAAINTSLISLPYAGGIAISGNNLYGIDQGNNAIDKFNATSGALTSTLVIGVGAQLGIAISGNDLYVANYANDCIGEYDATTGAAINASLVPDLAGPEGLAIVPAPEPSSFVLTLGGATLLMAWLRRRASWPLKWNAEARMKNAE